jgi:hypothetical protein
LLTIVVVMVVILLVAGLVVAYVAYPGRGEEMPAAPWLGDALGKAVDSAPVLEEEDEFFFRLGHGEQQESERR